MALSSHERLRGIFHPHEFHTHMDPTGAIEEWVTVEEALDAFKERASGGRATTHYLGQEPKPVDGFDVTDTAFMDVWIADAGEEAGVGEMWQRWRLKGTDVDRDNF